MVFIKCVAALVASAALFSVAAANDSENAPTAAPAESEVSAPPDEAAPNARVGDGEQKREQVADSGDQVICKYTPKPGSRLGSKVCMTRKEWDQIRRDSQEGVDNMQRQNTAPGLPQG